MNKHHVRGTLDKAKGAFKVAFGKLVGNKELEAEGEADKAAGVIEITAGDAEDAAKKLIDKL